MRPSSLSHLFLELIRDPKTFQNFDSDSFFLATGIENNDVPEHCRPIPVERGYIGSGSSKARILRKSVLSADFFKVVHCLIIVLKKRFE